MTDLIGTTQVNQEHAPMLHFHEGIGTPKIRLRDVRGGFRAAASDPIDDTGAIYFNTSTKRFRAYDGTSWYNLAWASDTALTGAPIEIASVGVYEGTATITAHGGDAETLGAALAVGTFHKWEIEWDANNNRVRGQLNDGAWSNWCYLDIGWDGVNGVRFNGKGEGYWDELTGTVINDNFDSYTVGDLDKQGSWSGSTFYDVSIAATYSGTNSVYSAGDTTNPHIDKMGTIASTGTQTIYARHESNAAGQGHGAIILIWQD